MLNLLLNQRIEYESSGFSKWNFLDNLGGATPLHCAAYQKRLDFATFLLDSGAATDQINEQSQTPLLFAVEHRCLDVAEVLLDRGAQVNCQDYQGDTALMFAVKTGFVEVIDLLVHRGASFQLHSFAGRNLLHAAALGGSLKLFRYFLDRGVDPYHRDVWDVSPILYALQGGGEFESFILQTRLLAGMPKISQNLLSHAISSSNGALLPFVFRSLPKAQALEQLNSINNRAVSPLCIAAQFDSVRSVKKLLHLGAELEFEGSRHGTVLMIACAYGRLGAVQLLVREGARIAYVNEDGVYRCAFIAARNHPQILDWLLVLRYQDQHKLTFAANCPEIAVKPWSGLQVFKYRLEGLEMKSWGEPLIEYAPRLLKLKKELLGRVVGV